MSDAFRVLRIEFETREALDREWYGNLVNGGLFIPGRFDLLYGEAVLVLVDLPFAGTAFDLEGRVAQCIPVEFEENGGRSGVAIELRSGPEVLRNRLEDEVGLLFEDDIEADSSRCVARRSVAHVLARVQVPGAMEIEGRTRNLSLAGVLISAGGEVPPVGQNVTVAIARGPIGEQRSILGTVARHDLDENGEVCGIGVQFKIDERTANQTAEYLNRIKASEHARRLGGISGTIDTLGLGDLLMSVGQCIPRGRFTLMKSGQIGTVYVDCGRISSAQMGSAIGIKALVRMLDWEGGNFEFHANLSPDEDAPELGLPIEAALLEAARLTDESRRFQVAALPATAGLRIEHRQCDADVANLSKVEQKILDLAGTGITVSRLLDAIQEPDGQIEQSILELVDRGVLHFDESAPVG